MKSWWQKSVVNVVLFANNCDLDFYHKCYNDFIDRIVIEENEAEDNDETETKM